jgi:hypothetical protein
MQATGSLMNGRPGNDDRARDNQSPEGNGLEMNDPGIEDKLNVILIQIAAIQDRIWDCLEALRKDNRLSPELEDFARKVMKESSYWIDQCTTTSESPPILLRRTEIQLERLARVLDLIEKEKRRSI